MAAEPSGSQLDLATANSLVGAGTPSGPHVPLPSDAAVAVAGGGSLVVAPGVSGGTSASNVTPRSRSPPNAETNSSNRPPIATSSSPSVLETI